MGQQCRALRLLPHAPCRSSRQVSCRAAGRGHDSWSQRGSKRFNSLGTVFVGTRPSAQHCSSAGAAQARGEARGRQQAIRPFVRGTLLSPLLLCLGTHFPECVPATKTAARAPSTMNPLRHPMTPSHSPSSEQELKRVKSAEQLDLHRSQA